MNRATAGTYTHLSLAQSVQLLELLRSDYTSSGLNDIQFAELATERMGRVISPSQVAKVRKEFGIEANRKVTPPNPELRELRDAIVHLTRELSYTKSVAFDARQRGGRLRDEFDALCKRLGEPTAAAD